MTPQKHTIPGNPSRNYMLFDSVSSFNSFVDTETGRLTKLNDGAWKVVLRDTQEKINRHSEWYGMPIPSGISDLDEHKRFLGMHLLKELEPKIRQHLGRYLEYLDHEVMPKPKVSYNDKALGLFSFERASMGMFHLGKIHLGTPLERTTSQLNIELGRTGLHTIVKKVYAYFEHKETSYPSLRLYLMGGGNANVKGNEMLYVGLACAELVEFMEVRGVAVEVNVLLGTSFDNTVNVGIIRVKRFQDRVDKNQLLLMSSDPRYFRFRGFKALIALSNHFGLSIPYNLGSIVPKMGKDMVNSLGNDGLVFEQSYSLDSSAKEVKRIVETYKRRLKDAKAA